MFLSFSLRSDALGASGSSVYHRTAISTFSTPRGKYARIFSWQNISNERLAHGQRGCPVSLFVGESHANAVGATKVNLRNGVFKSRGSLIARSSTGNEFSCDSRQRLTTFATLLRFERPWSKLAHGFRSLNRFQSREEPPIYRAASLFVTRNVRGSFLDASKTSCLFALLCYNLSIINRVVNLQFDSDRNETYFASSSFNSRM